MRRVDPHHIIQEALVKAATSDPSSSSRIERIWSVLRKAHFSLEVDPFDQALSVLSLLDQAGCHTPGINPLQVREDSKHILTQRQAV